MSQITLSLSRPYTSEPLKPPHQSLPILLRLLLIFFFGSLLRHTPLLPFNVPRNDVETPDAVLVCELVLELRRVATAQRRKPVYNEDLASCQRLRVALAVGQQALEEDKVPLLDRLESNLHQQPSGRGTRCPWTRLFVSPVDVSPQLPRPLAATKAASRRCYLGRSPTLCLFFSSINPPFYVKFNYSSWFLL